ncbi:MAG: spermidine/putrescine ABC transporter substrate-binding protein [Elusimicrobiota bacterium]
MRSRVWLLTALLAACSGKDVPEVHFYAWDSYDDPEIFAEFEMRTGIRVVVDVFASNEELFAKLSGGARGYDVITPSDYMVTAMAKAGLLAELDKPRLPNLKHMDPRFMDLPYDPENKHSVPYMWGITGIGYDSEAVSPAPQGWSDLFDEKNRGRISILNDQREAFAMALQSLGYPAGERSPQRLREAQKKLLKQKPLVKTYISENIAPYLVSGEIPIAHAWSGDVFRAAREKPSLRFIIPKEGGILWQDTLCVPKTAANPSAAHQLIDFLMEPANMARLVPRMGFGCPNRSACELLAPELRADPTLAPQDAVLKRLQWIPYAGETAPLLDELWTELKAT